MIVARVTNNMGVTFNVRLVRAGDTYGLNGCYTRGVNDWGGPKQEPLVEFWDATSENDPRFTLGLGQFVSRYSLSTLTGEDRYGTDHRDGRVGIDLCGHVASWKVTGPNVAEALAAIERVIGGAS